MRLADFIATNMEPILAEWVKFAETSGPAARAMDTVALRDHAAEMLKAIVADLRTPQSAAQQASKSTGGAPVNDADTAAEVHGSGRAESGFTIAEMVSEYRALRASVIRLWTSSRGQLSGEDLEDLTRFNEAIDQALAESISRYTYDIDHSREIFVAILGHDLRTPIGTILMGSQHMIEAGGLVEPNLTLATRIARSARRMNQMVEDLLDFTRGRLGTGIPITRREMDLGTVARHAVEELTTAHPQATVQLSTTGDLRGSWDAGRIGQVVANLLGNAVQHGDPDSLITVTAQGETDDVVLRVHNLGTAIPASELPMLFSPFKRVQPGRTVSPDAGNLGLGLYIAERIVTAHGGSISVRSSSEAGTLFTVRLPRSTSP